LQLSGLALAALITGAWPAEAQSPGIIAQGNAAVTGFSGSIANPPQPGGDPSDYLTIDTGGPSVRVVDLSTLGPQGQLSNVAKPFTATAGQVGQVFGVALDNAPAPSIYVAATSAYGLSIYVPDPSGAIKRVHVGAPGAQFVPGQFGPPSLGGSGPQSIWRIDGTTGQASVFANVGGGSPEGPASLGGLSFDPASQQLFVADLATGLVHRFGLDATDRGTYDHGAQGLPAAGLPPVPPDPAAPIEISNPAFDTGNPATWGMASPPRRVFAVAVHSGRLYYSVAQPPQVWSVGIGPDGSFANDARLEVDVPSLQPAVEIASITFDRQGLLYVAERGATTGDYNLVRLANDGQSRVLRFQPKQPGDSSPGLWSAPPDQYAIGLPPQYDNADGGVALGYGYQQNGQIDHGSCGTTVWSTGERLLDPGTPGEQPGSYPTVDGLQGNASSLVEPQNMPPAGSWFVDYYDQPSSPDNRGFVGAIAILPCPPAAAASQACSCPAPGYTPPAVCPPGTSFVLGQCTVTVSCPPGTVFQDGACLYPSCPPGYFLSGGQCLPPPITCPPDTVYDDGNCVPIGCPPGLVQTQPGYCSCPPGSYFLDGRCSSCPPGMIASPGGICWCPPDTNYDRDRHRCLPNCPRGIPLLPNGQCGCPGDTHCDRYSRQCVPNCPQGIRTLSNGQCGCPDNTHFDRERRLCVPNNCPPGSVGIYPQCRCPQGQHLNVDKRCVADTCPQGQVGTPPNCKAQQCPAGTHGVFPNCVGNCLTGMVPLTNGTCGCPQGQHLNADKRCVADTCPLGQVGTPPNCKQIVRTCPAGTHGTPPTCIPDKCPQGQVGTPPNCSQIKLQALPTHCPQGQHLNVDKRCVADTCPQGQVGTPPNCRQTVRTCPAGTHGTPPTCIPDKCPQGQVGTPPHCKATLG